ncbi:MAG: HNH endonuclease [Nitrososphaerota archaeon]|jgi:5-methylcytosine-specific restriction endonuclease McrA|nr:HNH endonuclease [Nitrososphaerota archaeon]
MFFDPWDKPEKKRIPVPQGTKTDVYMRSKGKCEKCHKLIPKGVKPHIHHKDGNPKNNNKSNLKVICPNCHSAAHNKPIKRKKSSDDGFGFPDFSRL